MFVRQSTAVHKFQLVGNVADNLPEVTREKRDDGMPRGKPFEPGNSGRPKGARNKLGEAFIDALHNDFNEHGIAAIQKAREDSPIQYVKVIASLLPSEHRFSFAEQYEAMTDADLADRARQLAAAIAPLLAAGVGDGHADAESADVAQLAARVH